MGHTCRFRYLSENGIFQGLTLALLVERDRAAKSYLWHHPTVQPKLSTALWRDRQDAETYARAKTSADIWDLPAQLQPSFKGQLTKDTRVCAVLAGRSLRSHSHPPAVFSVITGSQVVCQLGALFNSRLVFDRGGQCFVRVSTPALCAVGAYQRRMGPATHPSQGL